MGSKVFTLLAALAGSAAAQEYYTYTATSTADVYAAQATAKSSSPVSHVKGKAFDRLAIIWLENTDYDLAYGDRMYLPSLPLFFLYVKRRGQEKERKKKQ